MRRPWSNEGCCAKNKQTNTKQTGAKNNMKRNNDSQRTENY
jgi:hypothetical protein